MGRKDNWDKGKIKGWRKDEKKYNEGCIGWGGDVWNRLGRIRRKDLRCEGERFYKVRSKKGDNWFWVEKW